MMKKMKKRANGKVAQRPKVVRDRINQMILDGVIYPRILEALGEDGKGLAKSHLINWRKTGHQDWLKQQERLEYMRSIREFAMEAARGNEGSVLHEAGLQLAAAQVYELLMDFEPESLKAKLKGSPENYARLVTVLSRLSEGGLKYERYRAQVALHKANIQKELANSEPGGITPETRRRIEQELNLM